MLALLCYDFIVLAVELLEDCEEDVDVGDSLRDQHGVFYRVEMRHRLATHLVLHGAQQEHRLRKQCSARDRYLVIPHAVDLQAHIHVAVRIAQDETHIAELVRLHA